MLRLPLFGRMHLHGSVRWFARLGLALVCSMPSIIHAARPMVIDDARVVDAKSCQLETWVRALEHRQEFWALPACNFFQDSEITLGGALLRASGQQDESTVFQIKHLLKAMPSNGSGYAFSLGNVHYRLDRQAQTGDDLYAHLISSHAFHQDQWIVHTNLGVLRADQSNQYRTTWGVGAEWQYHPKLWGMAEIYSQRWDAPSYQLGLRYWLIEQRWQVDTTLGTRTDGSETWLSIGARLLTDPFLPAW